MQSTLNSSLADRRAANGHPRGRWNVGAPLPVLPLPRGRDECVETDEGYASEVIAARFRPEAFAGGLLSTGTRGQVVCPVPNHQRGGSEAGYLRGLVVRREVGGSQVQYPRVSRVPRRPSGSGSPTMRRRRRLLRWRARFANVRRSSRELAAGGVAALGMLVAAWLAAHCSYPRSVTTIGAGRERAQAEGILQPREAVERFAYRRSSDNQRHRDVSALDSAARLLEVVENATPTSSSGSLNRGSSVRPSSCRTPPSSGMCRQHRPCPRHRFAADAAGILKANRMGHRHSFGCTGAPSRPQRENGRR
jgi:hypothetical protein